MSGSYGSLNSKYNTLYALYLQLQTDISGGYTLQEVLDAGNSANDKTIQLLSSGLEGNYSSTSINFVDNPNAAITTLNNNSLNSFNSTTGKSYSINADGLAMSGSSGTNYTTMGDGILSMIGLDSKYVALSPTILDFNGNQGTNGQVLTKNASNAPEWIDLPVSEIPDLAAVLNAGALASTTIDMDDFDLTNVANIITNTQTNLQGQFVFDIPPHVPSPILGNDAAPKGYVDSLVGQYAGGFNLFFNYSQTDVTYPTFKSLSQLISSSAGVILPTTIVTGNNFIAQFITEPLGIDIVPNGLFDAFIYGAIDSIGGDAHYYFELWKKTASNVDSILGTSGISPDINSAPGNNPTSYSMVLPISTAIPLELTDRLYVVLYVNYNGSSSKELSTYFEGNYYSFLQTSLNAGTTLLSSNNTWTGTNDFSLPPTTPNQSGIPANTDIVNYGTINTLISDSLIPIVSTLDYYITTDSPFFQYPPSSPPNALLQAYQYYGWYFNNTVALRKVDWYFAPDYAATVADVLGVYLNYFNVTTTSNDNLPFFSIYTKPQGINDVIPGFCHSIATYVANFTPTAATPFCSFMNITGTQPDPFPYGHQLGSMILSPVGPNPRGEYLPSEEILAISVGTNSTSPVNQVNFIMSKVGICLAQGNQELILNPQNIIVPASSWVGTATSNLNMSSFSIDASANNLSIGTLTSTGLTLGKSAATTNIQGNLQISGQSGSSGQYLQSNGPGSVPTWTTSTSGWVGTAGSQLNMGIYDISGAVLDNNGGTLAVGGNTTTTTIGKATTGITNLQGVVKINNSAGNSGEVLTSTGASTAPTWQTPSGGSTLPTTTQGPVFINKGFTGSAARFVYENNTFLNIVVTSVTAKYLVTGQVLVNSSGATTNLWANLGVQPGGGAQTLSGTLSAFNNLAMSNAANTTFSQQNSLAQCSVSPANLFHKLQFSFVHTPGAINTFSYAIWIGTNGGGSGTVYSMIVQQLTA